MTAKEKKNKQADPTPPPPPEPIDVVEGIPDRQSNPPRWKYLVLAGMFAAWIAFMLYCELAGAPPR